MKKLVTLLFFTPIVVSAQVQTTTGSGNFFNPLLWDCFCVPANGDSLVINHPMTLTASIYYDAGQIKVNATGSLTEDGSDRDVWVDGTGSLINYGIFDCYRMYISGTGSFSNYGTSVYFDSLWNQSLISNSGLISAYDFLNDQTGTLNNSLSGSATIHIDNNFNNQGYIFNGNNIEVGNNFSNCNIQSMDALVLNHGVFCVGNDFSNCLDDTLGGTGEYFVGGDASNFGVFDGAFDFNTSTGTLAINTGTVDPSVTFGTGVCHLSVENQENNLEIYPNPVNQTLFVSEANLSYTISSVSGQKMSEGTTSTSGIDVSGLVPGVYIISVYSEEGVALQKFVKN